MEIGSGDFDGLCGPVARWKDTVRSLSVNYDAIPG